MHKCEKGASCSIQIISMVAICCAGYFSKNFGYCFLGGCYDWLVIPADTQGEDKKCFFADFSDRLLY
jgi:hypothetical protein